MPKMFLFRRCEVMVVKTGEVFIHALRGGGGG